MKRLGVRHRASHDVSIYFGIRFLRLMIGIRIRSYAYVFFLKYCYGNIQIRVYTLLSIMHTHSLTIIDTLITHLLLGN